MRERATAVRLAVVRFTLGDYIITSCVYLWDDVPNTRCWTSSLTTFSSARLLSGSLSMAGEADEASLLLGSHGAPMPADSTTSPTHNIVDDSTFHWVDADTAYLRPANLPIAKPHRAWDRKPLSPFARRQARRGMAGSLATRTLNAAKHLRGIQKGNTSPPMKPVKKLCVESSFGVAPLVSQWESRDSPVRKIVTRAGAVGTELVALEETGDGEEQIEGNVKVEIVEEDGTTREVDLTKADTEQGWEDEDVFDDTMMHLSDAMMQARDVEELGSQTQASTEEISFSTSANTTGKPKPPGLATAIQHEGPFREDVTDTAEPPPTPTIPKLILNAVQPTMLPAGFVSPIKQRRKLCPRSLKVSSDGRRQTLPVQFAPITLVHACDSIPELESVNASEQIVEVSLDANSGKEIGVLVESEEGWEDVQEEEEETVVSVDALPIMSMDNGSGSEIAHSPTSVEHVSNEATLGVRESPGPNTGLISALPSSLVSTIDGSHPDLPVRHPSRRKSTSPLKKSVVSSIEQSHLIAFTPLKLRNMWMQKDSPLVEAKSPAVREVSPKCTGEQTHPDSSDDIEIDLPHLSERSTSAPPEPPNLSLHRPSVKPRVSDDTALLQSFLRRAAESKNSRRLSTSDQESLTNRRDSDTVQRALGSPAQPDVLADLDPNSPSPRKSSASSEPAATDNTSNNEKGYFEAPEETDEVVQQTRRSGRGRKKPQVLGSMTHSAPNRISIRGNANVDLNKSEVQERALLLKTNTRKNKVGSFPRMVRLTQLAAEQSTEASVMGDGGGEVVKNDGEDAVPQTRIRWAETLAVYSTAPEPEHSQVSEESSELAAGTMLAFEEQGSPKPEADEDADAANAPVPPIDTPSKPKAKMRRLPPRQIPMDAKSALAAKFDSSAAPESQSQDSFSAPVAGTTPAATKKRSRIATPAKAPKSTASLLPTADESAAPKAIIPKKKSLSKLPGPLTSVLGPTSSRGISSTTLLASPAKKKGTSTSATGLARGLPSAKSFAPTLDFESTFKMEAPNAEVASTAMASPAKKGRGGVGFFASGNAEKNSASTEEGGHEARMGLTSSPVKKRTRR